MITNMLRLMNILKNFTMRMVVRQVMNTKSLSRLTKLTQKDNLMTKIDFQGTNHSQRSQILNMFPQEIAQRNQECILNPTTLIEQ